jgi:hypothetical protein
MAQVLNVDVWYYTSEIDERRPLDAGQLHQFLKVKGYDDLLKELGGAPKPKRPHNRKPKVETAPNAVMQETDKHTAEKVTSTAALDTSVAVEPPGNVNMDTENTLEVTLRFSDDSKMKKAVDELSEQEAELPSFNPAFGGLRRPTIAVLFFAGMESFLHAQGIVVFRFRFYARILSASIYMQRIFAQTRNSS